MNISDSSVIRALKSEEWLSLDDIGLDDLPARAVRDLDFGDTDNSVFLVAKRDWSQPDPELDSALAKIIIRLVFSSMKFHVKHVLLIKLDASFLSSDNLQFLDEDCGCYHCNMIQVTYGITKSLIDSAFACVQRNDSSCVRQFGVAQVRDVLLNTGQDELKHAFLSTCPFMRATDEKLREKAKHQIEQIRNFYFKKNKGQCPLKEEWCG